MVEHLGALTVLESHLNRRERRAMKHGHVLRPKAWEKGPTIRVPDERLYPPGKEKR